MTKAKVSLVLFIIIPVIIFILSLSGVIDITYHEVFYFLLIASGSALVYLGIENEIGLIIFSGTCLFLVGILLLTKLNFNAEINNNSLIPIISSISSAGMLMVYLSNPKNKYLIVISFLLFVLSVILLLTQTKFKLKGFFHSILPMLNVYWPAIIIFFALIFLLRKK